MLQNKVFGRSRCNSERGGEHGFWYIGRPAGDVHLSLENISINSEPQVISLVCQASFLNRSVAEAIRKQTDCLQHIQHELYTKGQSFADNRDILNI